MAVYDVDNPGTLRRVPQRDQATFVVVDAA